MRKRPSILMIPFFMALGIFLGACEEAKLSGPEKIRWDREICTRCVMAISDPNYSAQVRGASADKIPKLYKFDDLGCAVIWLDKQEWKDALRTEVWVNDHRTGKWINARTAWFVKKKNTPMGYGLGAQTEKIDGALNYEQAKKHIYKVEERFQHHSQEPLQNPLDTHQGTQEKNK